MVEKKLKKEIELVEETPIDAAQPAKTPLAEFITAKMREQNLGPADVARRSGQKGKKGQVVPTVHTDSIRKYAEGYSNNPTIGTILSIARGLDVDPVTLFRVAAGLPVDLSPESDLDKIIRIYFELPPEGQEYLYHCALAFRSRHRYGESIESSPEE